MCLGTIMSGHSRVWAQSCLGTIVTGHNRVWAQSCLGTVVWAQSCLGTIVVEPSCSWNSQQWRIYTCKLQLLMLLMHFMKVQCVKNVHQKTPIWFMWYKAPFRIQRINIFCQQRNCENKVSFKKFLNYVSMEKICYISVVCSRGMQFLIIGKELFLWFKRQLLFALQKWTSL